MKHWAIVLLLLFVYGCKDSTFKNNTSVINEEIILPDTTLIPNDEFGKAVAYGRQLLLNTAYYIGPEGINGKYLGNKMNCTNCHQQAGTKPFSFNLMKSHERYPQYRARENTVITLAQRVNNCVQRPHNGKPLPLDSKEMIAILSYLKWINSFVVKVDSFVGSKNLSIKFPAVAASPERGAQLYTIHCQRCHGADGEGIYTADSSGYTYPPLWGKLAYQPGSSMHRVIMQAKWIKANMPHDLATWQKPVLTDTEALDIAAFVNNDDIHQRNQPQTFDYTNPKTKAIDYGKGPYVDTFSEVQHKYGPYQPIIDYWISKGLKPSY
ncbi:MAG: cytochrome C class I [Bacteroidetes bacterium]|nr:MAG: cytochrome C class I [Bacteroidota bacterium]